MKPKIRNIYTPSHPLNIEQGSGINKNKVKDRHINLQRATK